MHCDHIGNLPRVSISFGGSNLFEIAPDTYMAVYGEQCLIEMSGDSEHMYILGNTFMKNYYTVFDLDQNRIGIAPSVTSSATIS